MSAEASQTTTSIAATVMVPVPERGRRFTAERPVRWGDTDRHGRLRLDALARFLQDVANDDTRDAGFDEAVLDPRGFRSGSMNESLDPRFR